MEFDLVSFDEAWSDWFLSKHEFALHDEKFFNLVKALKTLGDNVSLVSMTGDDFSADYIKTEIERTGVNTKYINSTLKATPNFVVLYDDEGKRQTIGSFYCQ